MSINKEIRIHTHNFAHYRTDEDRQKLTSFIHAMPDDHRRYQLHTLLEQHPLTYEGTHEGRKKMEAEVLDLLNLPLSSSRCLTVFGIKDLAGVIFCHVEVTERPNMRSISRLMRNNFPRPRIHVSGRTHLNMEELHDYHRCTGFSHADLLRSSIQLRTLSLARYTNVHDLLKIAAERCPLLIDLDLSEAAELQPEGLFALPSSITALNLSGCSFLDWNDTSNANRSILNLPKQFPYLISLSIDINSIYIHRLAPHLPIVTSENLPPLLQGLPHLKSLSLQHCSHLNRNALMEISRAPFSLIKLDLNGCKKLDKEILIAIAKSHPNLTHLGIEHYHLSRKTFATLMKSCPDLADGFSIDSWAYCG